MRRREFLGFLGGAAAWPLCAGAQQTARPVIGYLSSLARKNGPILPMHFARGCRKLGLLKVTTSLSNIGMPVISTISFLISRLTLVERRVAAIVATGGGNSIMAAKAA